MRFLFAIRVREDATQDLRKVHSTIRKFVDVSALDTGRQASPQCINIPLLLVSKPEILEFEPLPVVSSATTEDLTSRTLFQAVNYKP